MPQFDNALLSHDDRSRFVPDDLVGTGATESNVMWGTVLVGGMVVARWRTDPSTGAGDATDELTVEVAGFVRLTSRVRSAIGAEARRLVRALHPRATLLDVAFPEG
jgi:hypothetical protein